jgi:SPP1 gp7 family putative phage head morphogenesis protein
MPTSNENLRDALTRHQVDLMAMSNKVRNRVFRLLNDTEADLVNQIRRGHGGNAESLLKRIRAIRSVAHAKAREVWTTEAVDLAQSEAAFLAEAMSAVSPVLLNMALPSPARLKRIATAQPLRGALLGDWADRLKRSDLERLEGQIRIGITQGESASEIARRLVGTARLKGADGVTAITRRQAQTLSRTAIMDVSNASKQAFYAENSDIISEEVWFATLDDRTCPVCGGRDGERFPVGEGPVPPAHHECRCLRVAVVDGEVLGDRPLKPTTERDLLKEFAGAEGIDPVRTRAALPRGYKGRFDQFSRKRVRELTGAAPSKTTYEEFLRGQSPNFQERVLGVEKARLFREGKMPLDRFRVGDRELSLAQVRALDLEDLGGLNVAFPQVGQRVESLLARGLSNTEVAEAVRREFPSVATSPKSVASIKTALKKRGVEFPAARVDLEPSTGAVQAVKDLEAGLPPGISAPPGWLATGEVPQGVYGSFIKDKGVVLGDTALKTIPRQQARQVAAHEMGHYMHKAGGITPSVDELASVRANIARLSADDRKRYGYYLSSNDELIAEIYSQALSPSPVTSQGLSAARFLEIFGEDVTRARARLGVAAVPKPLVAKLTPAAPVATTDLDLAIEPPGRVAASSKREGLALKFYKKSLPPINTFEDAAKFVPGLTPEAFKIIDEYTGRGYEKLNQALRGDIFFRNGVTGEKLLRSEFAGLRKVDSSLHKSFSAMVSAMDDALELLPVHKGATTRFMGIDASGLDDFLARYTQGAIIEEKAYTSATRGDGSAFNKDGLVPGGPNVILRIQSKSARSVHEKLAAVGVDEQEVIFPRGSKFKVAKIVKLKSRNLRSGEAAYEIFMEEL